MKKHLIRQLCLFMMVVLFVACKKEIDQPFLEEEPGVAKKKAPEPCKILSITSNSGFGAADMHWTFEYNSNNDPVSVITDQVGTGNPNLYFHYDENGRLTDIIGIYGEETPGATVDVWQVLEYNEEGVVTGSTNYVFGFYGDEPDPNSFFIYPVEYTHDANGRIIEFVLDQQLITYEYDSKGNLVLGGKKNKYDSKNNIHRTDPIWMFFDRDYSLNNPAGDLKYNHSKFPVQFNSPGSFLGKFFETATVVYDCP